MTGAAQGPTIHSARVLRQMDHLIMAFRTDPGLERPSVLLSLFAIGYTVELGLPLAGHVAYLWTSRPDGRPDREHILTDAPALATGLGARLRPGRWTLADPDRTPEVASFERSMLQPYGIGYRVRGSGIDLDARWEGLSEPVYASGPTRTGEASIATLLVESQRPSVTIDGVAQPGAPFPDPIWRSWFGSDRGSCILGLGETIFEARSAPPEVSG